MKNCFEVDDCIHIELSFQAKNLKQEFRHVKVFELVRNHLFVIKNGLCSLTG